MGLEVHAPGGQGLHPVVGETDRLTVAEEREVARLKHRLAVVGETLARPDAAAPAAGLGGQKIDPALPGGFVDGVGGFELADLPTELRADLGAGLVAQAQKDAGAERLQERPPRLGTAQHGPQPTDGLRRDDGDDAALPGERKGFLVAARVVLTDAVHVVAVGTGAAAADRAAPVLTRWTEDGDGQGATDPTGPTQADPDIRQKIARLKTALTTGNREMLREWGGFETAADRILYLEALPDGTPTKTMARGAIDRFTIWSTVRLTTPEVAI